MRRNAWVRHVWAALFWIVALSVVCQLMKRDFDDVQAERREWYTRGYRDSEIGLLPAVWDDNVPQIHEPWRSPVRGE